MIEELALCRVHRVGQQRNVTTIRYITRNSLEEVSFAYYTIVYFKNGKQKADPQQQVVKVQRRKKRLAEVTFGSGQLSKDGIGIETLLVGGISYILTTWLILV